NAAGIPGGGWGNVKKIVPKIFFKKHAGGGIALGDIDRNGTLDLLVMGIADSAGDNEFQYLIGWNLDDSGNASSWSDMIQMSGIGHNTDGGGVALYDIDKDPEGRLDLVLMGISDSDNDNQFRYRIGWNLSSTGRIETLSHLKRVEVSGFGWYHAGGGVTLGDIDQNGTPEMVFMAIDNPSGANPFKYLIGWDINTQGNVSWSSVYTAEALGNITEGGGVAMADLDGDSYQDILFMAVDAPSGENQFRYRIGWNFHAQTGVPDSGWGEAVHVENNALVDMGATHAGGGLAVAKIDANETPDIVVMGIAETKDVINDFKYRIGWNLNPDGLPARWSEIKTATGVGGTTSGGGAAIHDIDGNGRPDILFMALVHYPTQVCSDNHRVKYRIGWNLDETGEPASWSKLFSLDYNLGDVYQGGVVIGDIYKTVGDHDSPDAIFMYSRKSDSNDFKEDLSSLLAVNLISGNPGTTKGAPQIVYSGPTVSAMGTNAAGGGCALADLNNNGKPDLVAMVVDDPDGLNEFRYRIGWDLDQGYPSHWTRSFATFKNQLEKVSAGGGATLADVTGDNKLDLVLLEVANPQLMLINQETGELTDIAPNRFRYAVGKGIETDDTILLRQSEAFKLTGFNLSENHGTEVGVFYDRGKYETTAGHRGRTTKTYVYFHSEYLHGDKSMAAAWEEMCAEPYNLLTNAEMKSCAHADAGYQALSDLTRKVLERYPDESFANAKNFPLVFAITDTSAELSLEAVVGDDSVTTVSTKFELDTADATPITNRSLKLSWFDATTLGQSDNLIDIVPLPFDQVVDMVESWGYDPEEEENAVMHLIVWDTGESVIKQVGDNYIDTALSDTAYNEAISYVAKAPVGFAYLLTLPSRYRAMGLFTNALKNPAIGFRAAISRARTIYKALNAGRVGKVVGIQRSTGSAVTRTGLVRSYGKFARSAKVLKVAGAIVAIGVIGYMMGSIIAQQGASSKFGWAVGSFTAFLNAAYFGAIAAVACIPVVGTVLAGLIVLSDFIFGKITGEGWSAKAIQAIIDALSEVYMITEVDMELENSWTDIEDIDHNGLTVGDKLIHRAVFRSTAQKIHEDATDFNLRDTVIRPSLYVLKPEDGDYVRSPRSDDFIKGETFAGDTRTDYSEQKAGLTTLKAKINMKTELIAYAKYTVFYKECFVASCDTEYETDEVRSYTPIYLDVLPNTLQDFLLWSEDGESVVPATNIKPWANGDSYAKVCNSEPLSISALPGGVLVNDYDVNSGDFLVVKDFGGDGRPSQNGGTVILTEKGGFTYTSPDPPVCGEDSFTYVAIDQHGAKSEEVTVLLDIERDNQAPVMNGDTISFTLDEDQEQNLNILINVSDPDGDTPILVRAVSQPENGTVVINGEDITYTPDENWYGQASFQFVAEDGADACETIGTVELTVDPVDDPPITTEKEYTTDEDTLLSRSAPGLLEGDYDIEGEPVTIKSHTDVSHGTLTVDVDGSFRYDPNHNYYGADRFTYIATDGTTESEPTEVTINVAPVNDPVVVHDDAYQVMEDGYLWTHGVLVNDDDVDSPLKAEIVNSSTILGILDFSDDGHFNYTPKKDFSGIENFTYKVMERVYPTGEILETGPVTVTITVVDAHDNPLAVDDRYTLNSESELTVAVPGVLANDLVAMDITSTSPCDANRPYKIEGISNRGCVTGTIGVMTAGKYVSSEGFVHDGETCEIFKYTGDLPTFPA
ncbi:tandem-95 repeat protein, partial [bacterium]|nr:tandem-95 repeat protein [bacterium]